MARSAALIIQATFAPGKEPGAAKPTTPESKAKKSGGKADKAPDKADRATRDDRPPHPATLSSAQRRAAPDKAERPPHPAHPLSAQKKPVSEGGPRPPHPATVPRGAAARAAAAAQASFEAPPRLLEMGSLKAGKPLPVAVQRAAEEQFEGADFSDVRIHEGPEAAAIGALALTAGDRIFFAPGQYKPDTRVGRALLVKQLAYVVQQREGRVENPLGGKVAIVRDAALDAEAAARAGQR